jgi:uncharacterized protein YndB with AHSA1/START domain
MTDISAAMRAIVVERVIPHPPEKIWRADAVAADRGMADEE